MDFSILTTHLLSQHLIVPLSGMFVVALLPRTAERAIKLTAIVFSCVTFLLSIVVFMGFDRSVLGFQFEEYFSWIRSFNIGYHVGVDGIALMLVGLTTLSFPLAMISSWNSVSKRLKEYYILLLLLEAGTIGVFIALDSMLFYVSWEIILIPMYFIIGIWGGEKRIYASVKFFLFTITGSLLMLVAILWLGAHGTTGFITDYVSLRQLGPSIPFETQRWLFLAFALAFCIKVPLVPFHTWLPDAHTEAPTAGSVLLAGLLLKLGTFGLIRYNLYLFPQASIVFAPYLAMLGIIGIVYGALVSMVQPDMKRLIAYSSVSHLGFVVLGIFSMTQEGVQGAVIQMINHGLSTGMLFLLVGMIYDRRHTRLISEYGGLARVMPIFAVMFALALLASVGLPGLNGFIGEFLILLGTFKSLVLHSGAYAIVAATGVIFAALYLLGMYKKVFFGTVTNEKNNGLKDLNAREIAILCVFMVFIVWIGVYPSTFLDLSAGTVYQLTGMLEQMRSGIGVH